MPIKVKVAKAHEHMLEDPEIRQELESVDKVINGADIEYTEDAVNFVFLQGSYDHIERYMETVCLFVNKLDKPIIELYGDVILGFNSVQAQAATATVEFDEEFLGTIDRDEALLVHINIPVKGLKANRIFESDEVFGSFENVRVTFPIFGGDDDAAESVEEQ